MNFCMRHGRLGGQNFIRHAAIDAVHRGELALLLAGDTEFAEHGAVQLHLEDLAGGLVQLGVLRVRVGIGGVEILVPGPGVMHRDQGAPTWSNTVL